MLALPVVLVTPLGWLAGKKAAGLVSARPVLTTTGITTVTLPTPTALVCSDLSVIRILVRNEGAASDLRIEGAVGYSLTPLYSEDGTTYLGVEAMVECKS
jgi:hypothetical protein